MSTTRFSMITITCLIVFPWNPMTDGLVCYVCRNCNDPFNRNYIGVIYENDTSIYFCSKTSIGYVTSRSIMLGCTSYGSIGNGQWCCQTDLCNGVRMNRQTNHVYIGLSVLILMILF